MPGKISRKKPNKQNNDKSEVLDGLRQYQYRFALFVKFLKDENAEIYLPKSGITYYSKPNVRNKPKLIELIQSVTSLSKNKVDELLNPNLILKKANSYKLQVQNEWRFIDKIQFYLTTDGLIESRNSITGRNLFGVRCEDVTKATRYHPKDEPFYYYSENDDEVPAIGEWNQFIYGEDLKDISKNIFMNQIPLIGAINVADYYPFKKELMELESLYGSFFFYNEANRDDYLVEKILRLLTLYHEFHSNKYRDYRLIPGYIDFLLPRDKISCIDNLHANFLDVEQIIQEPITIDENSLLNYRYEFLWYLKQKYKSITEWDKTFYVLLLLCYMDFEYTDAHIDRVAKTLMKDVKFLVFTSKNNDGTDRQEHGFSYEELSEILSECMFTFDLKSTLKVNGDNLLKGRLTKLPDPLAIKSTYKQNVIHEHIEEEIFNFFRARMRKGLNIIS